MRTILRGIAVAGAIAALYGIAQYFGWDPFLPAAAYHIGEGIWTIVRPPGTLGYVSYFATWLLVVTFLSLALAAHGDQRGVARIWRVRAAALSVIAMLLTGTRAAVLGLAAGCGVWLYRSGFRVGRPHGCRRRPCCVVAAAASTSRPLGWKLRSRDAMVHRGPLGRRPPDPVARQPAHGRGAAPCSGYGPEVFTATFRSFESKALARAYPDFSHESPHNIFLDALVSQGIPGVAASVRALCAAGLKRRAGGPARDRGSAPHWPPESSASSSPCLPCRRP